MRLAFVIVLLLVTRAAFAGSPDPVELAKQIETGSPRVRQAAAEQLAALVVENDVAAQIFAARFSLTDDAKVRAPLLASLVDAGRLLSTAAKRVPARSQLATRLRKHGFKPDECMLQLHADRDEALLACTHLVEARCLVDTIATTTVTIGERWTIDAVKRSERPNNLCDF